MDRVNICIDGNIGAGKSTLLDAMQRSCLFLDFGFHYEPLGDWEVVGDEDGKNIMELFYEDPSKYAFSFQMLAFISRLASKNASSMKKTCMERGLISDRLFAHFMKEEGCLNLVEYQIYCYCWNIFANITSGSKSSTLFTVYLRLEPEECLKRVKQRNRMSEKIIDYDYLGKLHKKHDDYFLNSANTLVLDGNDSPEENAKIVSYWIKDMKGENSNCSIRFIVYSLIMIVAWNYFH